MATAQFVNSVYTVLLDAITEAQKHLPELVLYLQPYKSGQMNAFSSRSIEKWPSYYMFSTNDDFNTIQFVAEAYGWENKEVLWRENKDRWNAISNVIQTYMKDENPEGLYRFANSKEDKICQNLLLVRNMRKLEIPIPVGEFVKVSNGQPLQERSSSGGWSEVQLTAEQLDMLEKLTRD